MTERATDYQDVDLDRDATIALLKRRRLDQVRYQVQGTWRQLQIEYRGEWWDVTREDYMRDVETSREDMTIDDFMRSCQFGARLKREGGLRFCIIDSSSDG